MNKQSLVSVIIPTYGRSELLDRAIQSVLNQTYKNIEIIIVDDNSSDSKYRKDTEALMQKYFHNNMVVYNKHEENLGGGAARNTGIKVAKGKYIGFLDDDDTWLEEFIEKHLEKIIAGADIVYCNYFLKIDKFGADRRTVPSDGNLRGNVYKDLLTGWCPATTSLFLLRKECFSDSCMFDESLQGFQDYDLWLTMSKKYKFDYSDDYLVVKYEHSTEQVAFNPVKRQNALNTLKKKWSAKLSETELHVFNKTTDNFQKRIFLSELFIARENKQFNKSIKKARQYIGIGQNSTIEIIKLFLTLLFGSSIINLHHKVKNKLGMN